jgi:hypothetical protein
VHSAIHVPALKSQIGVGAEQSVWL